MGFLTRKLLLSFHTPTLGSINVVQGTGTDGTFHYTDGNNGVAGKYNGNMVSVSIWIQILIYEFFLNQFDLENKPKADQPRSKATQPPTEEAQPPTKANSKQMKFESKFTGFLFNLYTIS